MTTSHSNDECVWSFSGLSSTTSPFTGQCVDSKASLNPSSCCIGASQPIIAVSLWQLHDSNHHQYHHTYISTQSSTMLQGHAAPSIWCFQTVLFTIYSQSCLCIHGENEFSRRALGESGKVGLYHSIMQMAVGISNKAKTTLTDKPLAEWVCKNHNTMVEQADQIEVQGNFWQISTTDWFQYCHRSTFSKSTETDC